MPPILDPFKSDAFSMASLTDAINLMPNTYGRVGQLGIFSARGVNTRNVEIESRNGVLTLLPTKAPGSPGTVGNRAKRKMRAFVVPHIPHDDVVLSSEVQGVRAWGSQNDLEAVEQVVVEKLADMRNRHAITLEWLKMGALKGKILDADGTDIYDLFAEFGVTQEVVDFDLATSSTNVRAKTMQVKRHIEDNLLGEVMSRIYCLCGEEFFDAFVSHPSVEKAYANWQAAQDRLGGDVRQGFTFGDVTLEEYRGRAVDPADGTVRPFLGKKEAIFFPLGTVNTFRLYYAPADFMETVNQLGQEMYAKQEPMEFNRGVKLHSQSNPLPLCLRPGVLVKGTTP